MAEGLDDADDEDDEDKDKDKDEGDADTDALADVDVVVAVDDDNDKDDDHGKYLLSEWFNPDKPNKSNKLDMIPTICLPLTTQVSSGNTALGLEYHWIKYWFVNKVYQSETIIYHTRIHKWHSPPK